MTTLFACFVDKHCYELRPVEASPVSDPCSGELQELDLTRADLRRGHSHLHWASVRSVVCRPGRDRTRKKMLGTSAKQDDEKNTYMYSCSCMNWARLHNEFEGRIAGLRLLYSRSRKPSRAIAMVGFLPGRRRDWSDLVRPRWDRRHFSAAKNWQKNHWIAWQCTFNKIATSQWYAKTQRRLKKKGKHLIHQLTIHKKCSSDMKSFLRWRKIVRIFATHLPTQMTTADMSLLEKK